MDCEYIEACPFFNSRLSDKPMMTEMVKRKYCRSNPEACARYVVRKALGKDAVPANLYPMDASRAQELTGKS